MDGLRNDDAPFCQLVYNIFCHPLTTLTIGLSGVISSLSIRQLAAILV